ncbi:uncharacterized protein RJT20DRAFT_45214 [Scheffersomyces xylosifermentans]|uniref:uncharacterized protein n=1 Tax=Scheffersomyces xylosifermentans TaxID=1304137 RepID=UPI00315D2B92
MSLPLLIFAHTTSLSARAAPCSPPLVIYGHRDQHSFLTLTSSQFRQWNVQAHWLWNQLLQITSPNIPPPRPPPRTTKRHHRPLSAARCSSSARNQFFLPNYSLVRDTNNRRKNKINSDFHDLLKSLPIAPSPHTLDTH